MTTDDFIDLLQQRQLVSSSVARQLREKSAKGDTRITPKSILKYLVKKEQVTRAQAKQLLETTIVVSDKAESSILGLVPLPDVESQLAAKRSRPTPAAVVPPNEIAKLAAKSKSPTPAPAPIVDDLFAVSPLSPATADLEAPDAIVPLEYAEETDALAPPPPGGKLRLGSKKKKGDKKSKRPPKKSRGKSEWESPLLLLGGGGLVLLVLASFVLWWLVFRESADALLQKANDAFEQGHYQVAIEQYGAFVEKNPRHEDYSYAKVRMGMAKLWEAAEGRNYAGAAEMAPTVIAQIENEPAFIADEEDPDGLSRAKRELSELLTKVAQGLAEQAESSQDDAIVKKRIEQIDTVLALSSNTKYVPPKLRYDSQLDAVRESLQKVQTREQREADSAAALANMDEAIKRGEPAAALAVRAGLLKNYPVLLEDEALAAKVLEISAAEKAGIKFVEGRQDAAADEPKTSIVAELALADRRGEAAAANAAAPFAVRVDGAVYALNAADGALLWRRFVGLDSAVPPVVLANGNLVVPDSQRGELACLNAQTGKLVWRLPLEGKLATPVAMGERLLVASDAGKLFVLEQATGTVVGHVPFSQPLRVAPVVSDQGDRVYLTGEHSNLYTLSAADLSCLGVHYLGHAAGGVAAPPIVVLNKVVVAENATAETSRIRVLSLDERSIPASEIASHRLSGIVVTPLQPAGRRFAAVTTLGQAAVFEAGAGNDKAAVTVLAAADAQDREQLAHYGLLHEGHLWLAGQALMKLAILPTGNQLPAQSLDRDYQGDAFDYPLQAVGNSLIHVRRAANQAGAIVSAMDAAANRPLWETALAVPPAGPPAVDASGLRITAGAASGAVYQLDREAMTRRVQNQAQRLNAPPAELPVLTDSLDLGQGRLVLGGVEGTRLLHFRPGDPRQPLKAIELSGPLSCPLVAWRDGFVAATNVGQVALHNADDAAPAATAFQPELIPGRTYNWLRPAVVGAGDAAQLAVSDGVAKLHLVAFQPQPQPHLKATVSVDVGPSLLVTPLAAVGSRVYAGNDKGQLASFTAPALSTNEPIDLGGRAAWGPHGVGDGLLVANEGGELMMVGEDGALRWRQPLKHGELAGAPLVDDGNAFLLFRIGGVARIALADGAEGEFLETGQPAVAGPVAFGQRLILSAFDGTLLVVNRP